MPKYCLDTSWISNPLIEVPPDIHSTLWSKIYSLIENGVFCWTGDIWAELSSITGDIGDCLAEHNKACCFEIGTPDWNWTAYLSIIEDYRTNYKDYISEYNGNRKSTIGLTDCSIVALGATLSLPVASMERRSTNPSLNKLRIPELCDRESIGHFNFNELLRAEGISV